METDTREDTASTQTEGSDRHLSAQQTRHTDTNQSTQDHILKASALPVLFGLHCSSRLLTRKQNIQAPHCPTLADGVPTDPIDESSCSQSHWSQHKTTDEDKTLLTTPSSTLRAQSGPFLVLPLMCFLQHGIQLFSLALSPHPLIFPPLIFLPHASLCSYPFF